jgi:hypothetical protein
MIANGRTGWRSGSEGAGFESRYVQGLSRGISQSLEADSERVSRLGYDRFLATLSQFIIHE